MKLVKRNPFFPEFSRFFDDFLTRDLLNPAPANNSQTPAINVKESDAAFDIEIAAPGINKEDFKIELHENTLSISGEHRTEKEHKDGHYTHNEFFYSNFARSFTLPEGVDTDKIGAKYENGILQLTLPKKEELKVEKAIKTIPIG